MTLLYTCCTSFDFSNEDDLQHVDSFSTSSDDSDSYDEPSDFLIAGPNHTEKHETYLTKNCDDGYTNFLPNDQNDDMNEEGDVQTFTTGKLSIESNTACEITTAKYEPLTNSVALQAEIALSVCDSSVRKGWGFSKKRPTSKTNDADSFHPSSSPPMGISRESSARDISILSTVTPPELLLTMPKSDQHLAQETECIDSEDNRMKPRHDGSDDGIDGGIPFVPYLEPIESIEAKKKSRIKHAAVLGRVAKTVKSSTVITGKHMMKHSKKVGKGTVKAGKAAGRVIPVSSVVYPYKPPDKHEPGGRVRPHLSRKNTNKEHIKAVDRAM